MPRVSLFATCIVDAFHPEIGEAVVTVLERAGVEVTFPPDQTCCGLPMYNNGYAEEAKKVARHTVEAMRGSDPVVVPSGSCGWMLRHVYPTLVDGDEARAFSRRVVEFSEYLVENGIVPARRLASPKQVTYHPSCHLSRGMRIDRPPRRLLESIEGCQLKPLEREGECCGFGGTFAVRQAALSGNMLADKLDDASRTGADTLVVTDPGCLLHLDGGARRRGCPLEVRHLAELLADAEPDEEQR